VEINFTLTLQDLAAKLERFWELSGQKLHLLDQEYDSSQGSPVFTIKGKYTTRGWTEWTQGFQYGSYILQYDATGDQDMLEKGRALTLEKMATHVGHFGVHDHGFNNLSTYGNLLRLMLEGKIDYNTWERHFYELALKLSGAVQARRWTPIPSGGYLYSFNGPHSLFVDTMRTIRVMVVSHMLNHTLMEEHDESISLLKRSIQHAYATAKYAIYYGEGRDAYDVWGRTAHESVFNTNDGHYRCPNSQQGFSGFTTWTRGLSWAMVGFAEQLEALDRIDENELDEMGGKDTVTSIFLKAAKATCDFYIENTSSDGIPYWDTGAPLLHKLGDYRKEEANPYNEFEPVDTSAAAIGSQGLLRLGKYLGGENGEKYYQAGLTVVNRLLEEPHLSTDTQHQGILLHSIYHRPNGWDYIPEGSMIPHSESCMWGDYHMREVALYVQRMLKKQPYYTFFGCVAQ